MRAIVLLALVGCYRPPAFDDPCAIACTSEIGCPDGLACVGGRCGTGCTGTSDSGIPLGCFGDDLVEFCPSSGDIMPGELLLASDIDTDDVCPIELAQAAGGPACVFAGESISIGQRVRFHGARAVVLFSMTDIVVQAAGTLDLSQGGAGSQPPGCPTTAPPAGTSDGTPAAGGAGGSFGTVGGAGGKGGVVRQVGDQLMPLTFVRGGCDGLPGGGDANGTAGVKGGRSGGGIWLLAGNSIQIAGRIHANGFGGAGALLALTGGGGGGAGGLVGLEAKHEIHLLAGALVVANGGGGGGGSHDRAGTDGMGGMLTASAAAGGMGGGMGIDGGFGWPGNVGSLDGQGPGDVGFGGGGGGGGGAGIIRIVGVLATDSAIVSPPPMAGTTTRHAR